ncbi:tetratricopeptide repeat protein [Acidisoma sp.]|uniref:tetratricopeptide repeat protein n=1 Tax=Acidisoma sp. TaxID=1872115 RepID=UPI003B00DC80
MTDLIVCCCILLALIVVVGFLLTRNRKADHILFNRSRAKKALTEETKRQFRARGWLVRRDEALINLGIDFSVECPLATFEVVCLDQSLTRFLSETAILERFEILARQFRLRKACLIVVTDGSQTKGFVKSAQDRKLVLLRLSEVEFVTQIITYVDLLPDTLDDVTLRAMEGNSATCASLMYRLSKKGEKAKAIEWGKRALKAYAGYFVHNALFFLLIDNDDLDEAEKIGQEALSFKPKDASAFYRGFQKIAFKRGNGSDAVSWAERWVKAEPGNSQAYANLATIHQEQGDLAFASSNINKAMELDPANPDLLRRATLLSVRANNLDDAFDYATKWVSYAAGDVGAYETLADVLLKQARYDEAAASITEAMSIQSDRPSLLRKASLVALQRGDLPASIQFAERWRFVAPTDAWAHDHLSTIYLRGARFELAQVSNSKARELDPNNLNFLRRGEQIEAQAGKSC